MTLPAIDTADLVSFLTRLLNTPSPTGFTHRAISVTEQALEGLPVTLRRTRKGALVIRW